MAAACLIGMAAGIPAFAQPTVLSLPTAVYYPCSAALTIPCVSFTQIHLENDNPQIGALNLLNGVQPWGGTFPSEGDVDNSPVYSPVEYYDVVFGGPLPSSLSIQPGVHYVGWSASINNGLFLDSDFLIYNLYTRLPPAPWVNDSAQFAAINWLVNHKPASVTYQNNCNSNGTNCTGSGTTTDDRTIRDVIQQVIWLLLDPNAPYCCSLISPGRAGVQIMPQYNASWDFNGSIFLGGGVNITAAITSLYHQALQNTNFTPGPCDTMITFVLDAEGVIVELPPNCVLPCVPVP